MISSFNPAQDTVINQVKISDTSRTVINQTVTVNSDSAAGSMINVVVRKVQTAPVKPVVSTEKPATEKQVSARKPFETWNTSTNFLINNALSGKVDGISQADNRPTYTPGTERPLDIIPKQREQLTTDWLLGIFMFLVILFVWIRVFYSKFFGTLANALASYHLSFKLFEEKNVLLHRVSIVLDFIYIIVFSVFVFELIEYYAGGDLEIHGVRLFLILFNIIAIYALMRVVVLKLTGSLFLARPLFAEYVHNTFVINKVLGIALFPVVIMAQYLPFKLIPVILILGVVVFIAAFILKTMRAYQIILRRDVLLFYLILYLCTLEILPVFLGYKFVTALIQNN